MDKVKARMLKPYEKHKLKRMKRQLTNSVNCLHARIILLSRGGLKNRQIASHTFSHLLRVFWPLPHLDFRPGGTRLCGTLRALKCCGLSGRVITTLLPVCLFGLRQLPVWLYELLQHFGHIYLPWATSRTHSANSLSSKKREPPKCISERWSQRRLIFTFTPLTYISLVARSGQLCKDSSHIRSYFGTL